MLTGGFFRDFRLKILTMFKSPITQIIISSFFIFPLINTSTGQSIYMFSLPVWKVMALIWGFYSIGLFSYYFHRFLKNISRWEIGLWVFMVLMLLLAPGEDYVIVPAKHWFFSFLFVVYIRLLVTSEPGELKDTIWWTLFAWSTFLLTLFIYVLYMGNYPGSIQHQIFLTGYLGFIAGMRLLLFFKQEKVQDNFRKLDWAILSIVIINIMVNIGVNKTRSVLPFSLVLVLIALAWLFEPGLKSRIFGRRWIVWTLLALLLSMTPILHLSGMLGNTIYDITGPIFHKIRTIESPNGREVAFREYTSYLIDNWQWVKKEEPNGGETKETEQPVIVQVAQDNSSRTAEVIQQHKEDLKNLLPYLQEKKKWAFFGEPRIPKTRPDNLAITSPHNLWLDATVRAGLLYTALIMISFVVILIMVSKRLSSKLSWPVSLALWLLLVSWGIAVQLDDEHWLYHIPFLTFIFMGIVASYLELRKREDTVLQVLED